MRDLKAAQQKHGHIYFITDQQRIKIGFSNNPIRRLREMQTGHPLELKLIGSIPGCEYEEFVIHHRFNHLRLKGEWFTIDDDLMDFIEQFEKDGVMMPARESKLRERIRNFEKKNEPGTRRELTEAR